MKANIGVCAKSVMDRVVVVAVIVRTEKGPMMYIAIIESQNPAQTSQRAVPHIGVGPSRCTRRRLGPPVAAQTAHHRCWIPAVQLCFRLRRFSPHFMPGTMVARWRFIRFYQPFLLDDPTVIDYSNGGKC